MFILFVNRRKSHHKPVKFGEQKINQPKREKDQFFKRLKNFPYIFFEKLANQINKLRDSDIKINVIHEKIKRLENEKMASNNNR